MKIETLIERLSAERSFPLDGAVYEQIRQWKAWWRGMYPPFHRFQELDSRGGLAQRQLYSLRMAKKICEDWAGLLLNERTCVTAAHPASSLFLQGENGEGGILESCRFWQRVNALVEAAFCTGTGAVLLRLKGMRVLEGRLQPDPGTRLELQYIDAQGILPLSVENGEITEAAFCSERLLMGKRLLCAELHTLGAEGYCIENRCFEEKDGMLRETALPPGIAARLETGSRLPLFAIIRPNTVSTLESSGLGESVFAQAIDALKGVDLAFNNFCRDFQLGGKKVFYRRSLLADAPDGGLLAPDDICQQLFVAVGESMPDEPPLIQEHNPALRVQENIDGLQAQLDYLSFRCGLGARYYRFDSGKLVTATEYAGERQELMRNAAKHCLTLRRALSAAFRMLLWAGREACGLDTDPETPLSIRFDDSIITDRESERQRDRADVAAGLMLPYEYRMKWYGETEAAARARMEETI
ncbi:MAG: hypothetical protein HFG26_06205 [Provencibacterium sp.]|nr:hypothetical protein [Provencibacterium sp.]